MNNSTQTDLEEASIEGRLYLRLSETLSHHIDDKVLSLMHGISDLNKSEYTGKRQTMKVKTSVFSSSLSSSRHVQQSLGYTYGGTLVGKQAGKKVSPSAWGKSPSTKKYPSIYNSSSKEKILQHGKNNISMVGTREREDRMEEMVTQLGDPAPTQSKYQPGTGNQYN
ncbi:hypothetical protein HHI36_004752 [Cryptolaemus montrouzieri]|uniref:Uncharacterized protein n=1 Tax=Cryptolaemus montrouzieri TaxID=559131 RepID=A0ABD2NSR7_9CUCU